MKRKFSKSTKAAFALALAAVLTVPAISIPGSVAADDEETVELTAPVKYYDFESADGLTFEATAVDNSAKLQQDEVRGSNVLMLDDAVPVTEASVETSTMYAVDFDKKVEKNEKENVSYAISVTQEAGDAISGDVVLVSETTVNVIDHVNSSVTIDNPFAGRTDLVNEPVGYTQNYAPIWEDGVTISYWMKTNGTGVEDTAESPIISFVREKANMTHKDDRDKYKLAQLYFSLDKDSDEFKKMFAAGTVTTYKNKTDLTEKNGIPVKYPAGFWLNNDELNLLEDYGIFACMNEDYPSGLLYYLRLNEDGTEYTVSKVEASRIDLSKYRDITASGSEVRYGTEEGCLTFLASGGYVFTETGLVDEVYKGGSLYEAKDSERQFQRNTLRAYTYLSAGSDKNYLPVVDSEGEETDALVETTEWHYITYVIKNDSISLYVDGVVQDSAMFTNTTATCKVEVNKSFNKGFGYHNSASADYFPDIVCDNGGIGMLYQSESYLLGGNSAKADEENIIKDENGVAQIGYNGNCNADTIMEYITDELTQFVIGEDGPMTATSLMGSEFGSKSDTAIDNLAFFDVAFVAEEVEALYAAELLGELPWGEEEEEPGTTTGPAITTGPSGTTTGPANTQKPDNTEITVSLLGDADCSKKVDLADAKIVLKIALGIDVKITEQGRKNADYDASGKIDLTDAKYVLKDALGIKFTVSKK